MVDNKDWAGQYTWPITSNINKSLYSSQVLQVVNNKINMYDDYYHGSEIKYMYDDVYMLKAVHFNL